MGLDKCKRCLRILLLYHLAQRLFPQPSPGCPWTYERHYSFLLQCFWSLAFLFSAFLEFLSLCWHCHLFLHAVYLTHRTLSILITGALNSLSGNSNIPTMSGTDTCSFSLVCTFLPCNLVVSDSWAWCIVVPSPSCICCIVSLSFSYLQLPTVRKQMLSWSITRRSKVT